MKATQLLDLTKKSARNWLRRAGILNAGVNDRETKDIRWAMPARRRNRDPRLEDLRVRPGPQFKALLRQSLLSHETIFVQSDPGVGKTYTIDQELEELRVAGMIRGYGKFTVTKSVQPEDWFAHSLTIHARDGEFQIVLQPAPIIDLFEKDVRLSVREPDPKTLAKLYDPTSYIIIFIDEITRANPILVDAFLECLENGTFLINGQKFKLPVLFIFAANPPGMDGSCVVLSPAFMSRLTERLILFGADLDVLIEKYIPEAFHELGKKFGYAQDLLPEPELIRQSVVIWQLLSGLPLERSCYSSTPEPVKKLITDLATIDPVLRADLELIGKEVMRGPDARKPIKWVMKCVALAAARRRAGDLDARVTPDDFVRTSVRVLATGFRSKLNEDQQSDRLMELHKATYRVVNRVLGSEALCNHIRDSEGPYALAQRIVRTLLSA